jgi:hypothetical protein
MANQSNLIGAKLDALITRVLSDRFLPNRLLYPLIEKTATMSDGGRTTKVIKITLP